MRKIICLFFISVIYLSGYAQNADKRFIPGTDAHIQYTGRFDFTDATKPVFMYSGCTIQACFTGTFISIRLQDDSLRNWFTVKLDDSIFIFKSDKKEELYILAAHLVNKKHNITISRRTEWHGGNTVFKGLEIDKTATLFSVKKLTRTIELIGNSLTCGYGNEGTSRNDHFKYETENNYQTYGTMTARAFNAAYVAVCRSGIGMYQSYGGDTSFVQPKLYDEIVVGSKAVWDYKMNPVQVVLIELGANDLAKPLDSAAYVNNYIRFVKKIRGQYPTAKIICTAGPDSPDDTSIKFQTHVKAVTGYFAASDKNVFYFYFGHLDSNGSDWHPNINEHQQMADVLIPFIKKITGWK